MKSILDYIKVFKNIETYKGPVPRNMKLAKAEIPRHLWDNINTPDLEQSPDSFLKPGETLEDWDTSFRKPNAEGGQIIGKPGGLVEPGIEYYAKKVKKDVFYQPSDFKSEKAFNISPEKQQQVSKHVTNYFKEVEAAYNKGDMSKVKSFTEWTKTKYPKTGGSLKTSTYFAGYRNLGDAVNEMRGRLAKDLIREANETSIKHVKSIKILEKLIPKDQAEVVVRQGFKYKAAQKGLLPWATPDVIKAFDTLDTMPDKLSKALDHIVRNDLPIMDPSKGTVRSEGVKKATSAMRRMMIELAGGGTFYDLKTALKNNKWYQQQNIKVGKKTVNLFDYFSNVHSNDFVGETFSDAYDFAKSRRGTIRVGDIKNLNYPESLTWQIAARSANNNFKRGIHADKWPVQIFDKKGNRIDDLSDTKLFPVDEYGRRHISTKDYQFKYKGQMFNTFKGHKNHLKLHSKMFPEIYKIVDDMKTTMNKRVPNPDDIKGPKISLQELFEKTGKGKGFEAVIGHADEFGGVASRPFTDLKIMNSQMNQSLYFAYSKIKNKDLRKRVANEIYGKELKGLTGDAYTKAWANQNTKLATDIIKGKASPLTPYREAGQRILGSRDFLKWGPSKQLETLSIAGHGNFVKKFGDQFKMLSLRSRVALGKEHGCIKGGRSVRSAGGNLLTCLQTKFKADPEKFLQKSAPLAKDNVNLFNWFKNGRKIARGTGILLAWEAAFAPIIGGWAALEGESMPRIINEIAYGIPGIGETEKDEWMKYAGGDELAYKMKQMSELEEQDLPNLYQQRADVINKMSNVEGKSFHQRTIEDDIKEKELELQGLINTPEFYEGPVGSYYNYPVIQDAIDLEQQTTAKIAADKAARKKQRWESFRPWTSQLQMAGGGIVGIRKPSALPPTGGPQSGGLPSLYNNVRKR